MKRFLSCLFFLGALLAPGTLSAQMMPDSTVQIVAYWNVGDRVDYLFSEEKYDIDDEDETMTASSSETVRYEVLAATDSTYTLGITSLDGFSTHLSLSEKELSSIPEFSLRVRMSQLGEFLALENLEEILAALDKAVPALRKATLAAMTPEEQKAVDKKGLDAYLRQMIASEQFVDKIAELYLTPFFYHGSRLDTTMTYSFDNAFAALGDESLEMVTYFKVDPELTDDYSAVIRQETVAEDVNLAPLVLGSLGPIAENMFKGTAISREEIKEGLQDLQIQAAFEEYTVEEIQLETGWPLAWVFDRYVTATEDGKTQGKHIFKQIKLVTEEETEE